MTGQESHQTTWLTKAPIPLRIVSTIPLALIGFVLYLLGSFLLSLIPIIGSYLGMLLWISFPFGLVYSAYKLETGSCPLCGKDLMVSFQDSVKCSKCKNRLVVYKHESGRRYLAKAPS